MFECHRPRTWNVNVNKVVMWLTYQYTFFKKNSNKWIKIKIKNAMNNACANTNM